MASKYPQNIDFPSYVQEMVQTHGLECIQEYISMLSSIIQVQPISPTYTPVLLYLLHTIEDYVYDHEKELEKKLKSEVSSIRNTIVSTKSNIYIEEEKQLDHQITELYADYNKDDLNIDAFISKLSSMKRRSTPQMSHFFELLTNFVFDECKHIGPYSEESLKKFSVFFGRLIKDSILSKSKIHHAFTILTHCLDSTEDTTTNRNNYLFAFEALKECDTILSTYKQDYENIISSVKLNELNSEYVNQLRLTIEGSEFTPSSSASSSFAGSTPRPHSATPYYTYMHSPMNSSYSPYVYVPSNSSHDSFTNPPELKTKSNSLNSQATEWHPYTSHSSQNDNDTLSLSSSSDEEKSTSESFNPKSPEFIPKKSSLSRTNSQTTMTSITLNKSDIMQSSMNLVESIPTSISFLPSDSYHETTPNSMLFNSDILSNEKEISILSNEDLYPGVLMNSPLHHSHSSPHLYVSDYSPLTSPITSSPSLTYYNLNDPDFKPVLSFNPEFLKPYDHSLPAKKVIDSFMKQSIDSDPNCTDMRTIFILLNNMTRSTLKQNGQKIIDIVYHKYDHWFAYELIAKRIVTQPNFHTVFADFIASFHDESIYQLILKDSIFTSLILIQSTILSPYSAECKELKNLGTWLGLITLGQNKPLLLYHINIRDVLIYGIQNNKLFAVVPFVCNILKGSVDPEHKDSDPKEQQKNLIIKPPSQPWMISILSMLKSISQLRNLKSSISLLIESLFKLLHVDLNKCDCYRVSLDHFIPSTLSENDYKLEELHNHTNAVEFVPSSTKVSPRTKKTGSSPQTPSSSVIPSTKTSLFGNAELPDIHIVQSPNDASLLYKIAAPTMTAASPTVSSIQPTPTILPSLQSPSYITPPSMPSTYQDNEYPSYVLDVSPLASPYQGSALESLPPVLPEVSAQPMTPISIQASITESIHTDSPKRPSMPIQSSSPAVSYSKDYSSHLNEMASNPFFSPEILMQSESLLPYLPNYSNYYYLINENIRMKDYINELNDSLPLMKKEYEQTLDLSSLSVPEDVLSVLKPILMDALTLTIYDVFKESLLTDVLNGCLTCSELLLHDYAMEPSEIRLQEASIHILDCFLGSLLIANIPPLFKRSYAFQIRRVLAQFSTFTKSSLIDTISTTVPTLNTLAPITYLCNKLLEYGKKIAFKNLSPNFAQRQQTSQQGLHFCDTERCISNALNSYVPPPEKLLVHANGLTKKQMDIYVNLQRPLLSASTDGSDPVSLAQAKYNEILQSIMDQIQSIHSCLKNELVHTVDLSILSSPNTIDTALFNIKFLLFKPTPSMKMTFSIDLIHKIYQFVYIYILCRYYGIV